MTKLTIQQSNTEDNKPVVKHSVGQYYLIEEDVYILAQVGMSEVNLIGLESANRYTDPVFVKNVSNITPEEFNQLFQFDHDYTLLSSVDVTYSL